MFIVVIIATLFVAKTFTVHFPFFIISKKVKVKFTLGQDMKAKTGCRGIALLFP
jgi:hypothetical protein